MVHYRKLPAWLVACVALLLLSGGCSSIDSDCRHCVPCDPCFGYQQVCWRPWSPACQACLPPSVAAGIGEPQAPTPGHPAEIINAPVPIPVPGGASRGADHGSSDSAAFRASQYDPTPNSHLLRRSKSSDPLSKLPLIGLFQAKRAAVLRHRPRIIELFCLVQLFVGHHTSVVS